MDKFVIFLLPLVMGILATLASVLPLLLPQSRRRQEEERKKREDWEEHARMHEASLALVGSIPSNDKPCDLKEAFSILEDGGFL